MALTKAPFFGLDASGTIAGAVVFSKWKGRTYVRRHAVPHNPKSGLQVGMRSGFKFVSQDYANLSAAIVARWKAIADLSAVTPLNSQMAICQANIRQGKGPIQDPAAAAGTTPDAPTAGTATAQPKSLLVAWSRPAGNKGDYCVILWMSTVSGFTPATATQIWIGDEALVAFTATGLTTGTPYYFRVAEANTDGEIGALLAEFTGTPT